jgi:hypothetical protein
MSFENDALMMAGRKEKFHDKKRLTKYMNMCIYKPQYIYKGGRHVTAPRAFGFNQL